MKKQRRKKLNIKRVLLFIISIIAVLFLLFNFNSMLLKIENGIKDFSSNNINDSYDVIKHDTNSNYEGPGQKKVKNKDGYFTTFTTSKNNNQKTYIEYKQNGTSSWSNNAYWGSTMSENGCGITVMSIILSGYNKNYTPEDLRKKYYPVMNYENFSSELSSTFGIKNSDFYYDSVHLSSDKIIEHLKTNRPVVVCVWNKPQNNRWTSASHYMALLATDGGNMVYVSNPNRIRK